MQKDEQKIYRTSKKQEKLLEFVRQRPWVEQSRIYRAFQSHFKYKNLQSARKNVGEMLKKLEANGKLEKKRLKNESAGSIPRNVWRAL